MHRRRAGKRFFIGLAVVGLVLAAGGAAESSSGSGSVLPAGQEPTVSSSPVRSAGAVLLEERCTGCHSLKWVRRSRKDYGLWEKTVVRMIRRGAWLNDEERAELISYLADKFN